MQFTNSLIKGKLIRRYKRFFVDVKLKNENVTAHCPNTGSMIGLLKEGNTVWISKSDNPNRKLKYTLEIIEDNNSKVGVNTHSTNKIVHHALQNNLIGEFDNIKDIKTEISFGQNTRFDFLVTNKKYKAFVEYHDPFVPIIENLRNHDLFMKSIKITPKKIKELF